MTIQELRKTKDYEQALQKIKAYKTGFTFKINYGAIPTPKANALKVILRDAIEKGHIEIIGTGLDIDMNVVYESFKRL